MRIGFAGTPDYAAVHLHALIQASRSDPNPALLPKIVLSQPDRAAGRGLSLSASPVKQSALQAGCPVWTPVRLRGESDETLAAKAALVEADLDWLIVVAYGLLLPPDVLEIPRRGCINLHGSLLPRWRGAAPIQRSIEAGDEETGVCLMQMEAGLDTGPVWSQVVLPIGQDETTGELHDRMAQASAALLLEFLRHPPRPDAVPTPQPVEGVTYAAKLQRQDRLVDLRWDALRASRVIRSLDPSPGATLLVQGPEPAGPALKAGGASLLDTKGQWGAPGEVVRLPASADEPLVVACGRGLLGLRWCQRPGGKRLSAHAYAVGQGLKPGQNLLI